MAAPALVARKRRRDGRCGDFVVIGDLLTIGKPDYIPAWGADWQRQRPAIDWIGAAGETMKRVCAVFMLLGASALGQGPPDTTPRPASMKQLMLDLIHPASNDVLLIVYRGGPKDEKDWGTVRRGALTLAESGNLLLQDRTQNEWRKDAKLLADAGAAAYKAAQAKDGKVLAALAEQIDASCTTCHKQFRPEVFPREGGSK
jgi:hypothetical protein